MALAYCQTTAIFYPTLTLATNKNSCLLCMAKMKVSRKPISHVYGIS